MSLPLAVVPTGPLQGYAAVGLHVDVGSADESPKQRGHAHLLEHLLVRTHFPDSLAVTATTGRERTSFQLVTRTSDVTAAREQLEDLIHRRSPLSEQILAEERGIVRREVAERRQTRSWRVREAAFRALWDGTSYAHDPLAHEDDWTSSDRSSFEQILEQNYVPENVIVVMAADEQLTQRWALANRAAPFVPRDRRARVPSSPVQEHLHWGSEDLGHMLCWADTQASSRVRLVNRRGRATFQQLSLRGGWLTWVWVPPGEESLSAVDRQLASAQSVLEDRRSAAFAEFRIAELKRAEQVETLALQTVEGLWSGPAASPPLELAEGIDHWRRLVQEMGS